MNTANTNATYRAPDGSVIHNVTYHPDGSAPYYGGVRGFTLVIVPKDYFEANYTLVEESSTLGSSCPEVGSLVTYRGLTAFVIETLNQGDKFVVRKKDGLTEVWCKRDWVATGGSTVLTAHQLATIREKPSLESTRRDIGYAVAALKADKRVARAGWNGKGMFLFLLPASDGIPTKMLDDPALRAVIESELRGDTFDALGSVGMFTADKKVLTGWLASQSDLLAEDWEILG